MFHLKISPCCLYFVGWPIFWQFLSSLQVCCKSFHNDKALPWIFVQNNELHKDVSKGIFIDIIWLGCRNNKTRLIAVTFVTYNRLVTQMLQFQLIILLQSKIFLKHLVDKAGCVMLFHFQLQNGKKLSRDRSKKARKENKSVLHLFDWIEYILLCQL